MGKIKMLEADPLHISPHHENWLLVKDESHARRFGLSASFAETKILSGGSLWDQDAATFN